MSREDWIIDSIDKKRALERELSPTIIAAHKRALEEVLSNRDYVIQESDFVSVYGKEAVEADISESKRIRRQFELRYTDEHRKSKKIAEVLEAIILMNAEMNEWLGSATTLKTSLFDDLKNKSDVIAEWFTPQEGSRVLALAIDVTYAPKSVESKLLTIKKEIDANMLGTIRYFKDERGDFMGTRRNVPRVVVGVSREMIEQLAVLWLKNDNKTLGQHGIQRVLVEQVEQQLRLMRDYAEIQGKDNVVMAYTQALTVVQQLLSLKRGVKYGGADEDRVARAIKESAERIFLSLN